MTRALHALAVVAAAAMALASGGCAGAGGTAPPPGSAQLPSERQIIVAVHNDPPAVQRRAGGTARLYGGPAGYRSSPTAVAVADALARRYGLREVDRWPIEPLGLHCVVYAVPTDASREALLAALSAEPGVALAQPVQAFSALAATVEAAAAMGPEAPAPDGPARGVTSADVSAAEGSASVPAGGGDHRLAHRWATGRGVTVAVVDTGVDAGHPALGGRVVDTLDFVGVKRFESARERHGLAVAGVIAAGANARLQTVGVAPDARVLAARACWHTDEDTAVCNSFTLARALGAVLQRGVDVINLSLHGPRDPLLERLVNVALERGTVVVGALPDDGQAPGFPGALAGVLAVHSVEAPTPGQEPDALRAPGRAVLTLQPGGGYRYADGSSLAAAHVSGVVALLLEQRNGLSAGQVSELLRTHARVVDRDGAHVTAVVDACLALAALLEDSCADAAVPVTQRLRPPPVAQRRVQTAGR